MGLMADPPALRFYGELAERWAVVSRAEEPEEQPQVVLEPTAEDRPPRTLFVAHR